MHEPPPIKTESDRAAIANGCKYDPARADRVDRFFSRLLVHSKGRWAGQPFRLLDWQLKEIIRPLFGWVNKDGSRRFRQAYIEIPKKNGKSSLASGIGLYLLVGDCEGGAEVYSLGADREQASIVHGEAQRMVAASPLLSRNLQVNLSTKAIVYKSTNSVYKALSSVANTKEGLNAHGLIADELHAWRDDRLFETIRYAGRSRKQPLFFQITTAGDRQDSICWEQHKYAKLVLSGEVVDQRFFAYVCGAEPSEDWTAEEIWKKANPSLGHTIRLEDFAADCAEAVRRPAIQAAFRRYSLNTWGSEVTAWITRPSWAACQSKEPVDLAGRTCWCGLDLSSTTDLTACTAVFEVDGVLHVRAWCWMPVERLENPATPEQYRVWHREGWLRTTPGPRIDYNHLFDDLIKILSDYQVAKIAFDPWNAEAFTQRIETEAGITRVKFLQTIHNFASPCRKLESMVASKKILHDGNPLLAWQIENTEVQSDSNQNLRPVKPDRSQGRKIDSVVALLMAIGLQELDLPNDWYVPGALRD